MWKYLQNLISEKENVSSNRLMFLFWNFYIAGSFLYLAIADKLDNVSAGFLAGALVVVWGGKVVQKPFERERSKYADKINS